MVRRACKAKKADGAPCRAAPLRNGDFCLLHDPEQAETVSEARRLGGQHRRREVLLNAVHDFEGLTSIPDVMRLLEIAVTDCLGVERGLNRARVLGYLAQQATKLLQVGEYEERLEALESVLGDRLPARGRR